jgi:hypothetical protein
MNYKRIPTSAEVYAVIFARHRHQLKAFASFSDPDGTYQGADGTTGRMDTSWGIDGADCPLLEIRSTWPITRDGNGEPKTGERHNEYWICYPVEQGEQQ